MSVYALNYLVNLIDSRKHGRFQPAEERRSEAVISICFQAVRRSAGVVWSPLGLGHKGAACQLGPGSHRQGATKPYEPGSSGGLAAMKGGA